MAATTRSALGPGAAAALLKTLETLRVEPDPEQLERNVRRFADQHARWRAGLRPSPPAHFGLSRSQRRAIEAAVEVGLAGHLPVFWVGQKRRRRRPTTTGREEA